MDYGFNGLPLPPWAVATFLVAALQWFAFRYVSAPDVALAHRVPGTIAHRVIPIALAVVVVVLAGGSVVTVLRIG